MKLAARLPLLIVGCSLVTAAAVGVFSYYTASQELQKSAGDELIAIRESRRASLIRYLELIEQDLQVVASSRKVSDALRDFTSAFDGLGETDRDALRQLYDSENPTGPKNLSPYPRPPGIDPYGTVHGRYHPWFDLIHQVRGYYEFFSKH